MYYGMKYIQCGIYQEEIIKNFAQNIYCSCKSQRSLLWFKFLEGFFAIISLVASLSRTDVGAVL